VRKYFLRVWPVAMSRNCGWLSSKALFSFFSRFGENFGVYLNSEVQVSLERKLEPTLNFSLGIYVDYCGNSEARRFGLSRVPHSEWFTKFAAEVGTFSVHLGI